MRYALATIIVGATLLSSGAAHASSAAAATATTPSIAPADQEWAAYRLFYPAFVRFHNKAAQYPSLRLRLKLTPRKAALPTEGLVLQLVSASVDQLLPVESIGGVDLPISKTAYDEDGILRLNRIKGDYALSTQYSIQVRRDGVYATEWLRSACAQGQMVKKTLGFSHRLYMIGKACTGVTFQFLAPRDATVVFKSATGIARPMVGETLSYGPGSGPTAARLTVVRYRFQDWPQKGEIITQGTADVIDFVFE